jgi:hypothetical protein
MKAFSCTFGNVGCRCRTTNWLQVDRRDRILAELKRAMDDWFTGTNTHEWFVIFAFLVVAGVLVHIARTLDGINQTLQRQFPEPDDDDLEE